MSIIVFYYLLYFFVSLYIGYRTITRSLSGISLFFIALAIFLVLLGLFSEQWVLFILLIILNYSIDAVSNHFPKHTDKKISLFIILDALSIVGFAVLILYFKFVLHFNWDEFLGLK